jgi:hypothetical protein
LFTPQNSCSKEYRPSLSGCKEVVFPKFFLVVSGSNGAVMKTHSLICKAIRNYINIDPTAFTLGTPPTAANRSSPTLWLTANIAEPLAQAVINAHMLSSTNITIYTLPYNMPVIGFVGVFAGFMLPNTVLGANTARDLIGTAMEANNEITQFVQTHCDALGPQVSSGEAWRAFLASITVHGIALIVNDTNTIAWCLHVTPRPTIARLGASSSTTPLLCACSPTSPAGSARPPSPLPCSRTRAAPLPPKPRTRCVSTHPLAREPAFKYFESKWVSASSMHIPCIWSLMLSCFRNRGYFSSGQRSVLPGSSINTCEYNG